MTEPSAPVDVGLPTPATPPGQAVAPPAPLPSRMRQLPLPLLDEPPRSFETYLPGPNALALAELTDLALRPNGGAASPPVYLWGPPGSGKTHLLQSLAARLQAQGRPVGWFDDHTALPWATDDARVLTVFDRCDTYDAARQHAAFALFVDASSRGALVAAAGRLPPVDLPLREDLRSRLGWGHVFALQTLTDEEVRAVLLSEAARRGLTLSPEVTAYLLSHHARDLASLKALLDRADAFSLARKRAVLTVPMVKQMVEEAAADGAPA
jgi:DnaA-homolog protein